MFYIFWIQHFHNHVSVKINKMELQMYLIKILIAHVTDMKRKVQVKHKKFITDQRT